MTAIKLCCFNGGVNLRPSEMGLRLVIDDLHGLSLVGAHLTSLTPPDPWFKQSTHACLQLTPRLLSTLETKMLMTAFKLRCFDGGVNQPAPLHSGRANHDHQLLRR